MFLIYKFILRLIHFIGVESENCIFIAIPDKIRLVIEDKVLIQLNNVAFKYPGADYLFEDLKLSVKKGNVIAIVGANGSGKSTLLKILCGELKLDNGTQAINCKTYYVPQLDLDSKRQSIKLYEYISKHYEDWWEVLAELENTFKVSLDVERDIRTLSGGEFMKVNLSIAIKHSPDVLVLDEPTNHLDVATIRTLIDFINENKKSRYTFVLVSHDVYFLNNVVTTIWELENKKITSYGGNYDFYKEQKALHLRGIKKQRDVAEKKLNKAKEQEEKHIEKAAKKANQAKRAFIKGSLEKKLFSDGKNAAQSSQRSTNLLLEKIVEQTQQQLEDTEIDTRHLAFVNFKNVKDQTNRTIFEVKNAQLLIKDVSIIKKINLKVSFGDRVVLAGNNGSGKTTLLRAILDKQQSKAETGNDIEDDAIRLMGDVYVGSNLSWVYIDQHYSLIDPNLSLIENLQKYDKEMTDFKAKEQLGKMQFKSELDMNRLGKDLSGGEMVRLIFAMISAFPIDLIVLDEPTNNLDIETTNVLVKALNLFRGAIIVVSHNVEFLSSINIKTAYMIKNSELKLLPVEPSQKDAFYRALLA